MELYILDSRLRRIEVIDQFESLIWTERWGDIGDFELIIHSTPDRRRRLVADTMFATNESDRVMVVETVENSRNSDGLATLSVTGRTIEKILDDRVATEGFAGLTDKPEWVLTGTPGNIARHIFQKICVEGILSPADIIPFITDGTLYPVNSITEPDQVITMEFPIASVYESIKDICDIHSLGYRLVRNLDASELYFDIYTGSDRTTQQSSLAPVVFSPNLDNLQDIKELSSVATYKNVAYVISKNGTEVVYANGVDPSATGFKRRVMVVDANDIDEAITGPELQTMLINKGLEELAKNRSVYAFDGEIPQTSSYLYGIHYHLGDIVEMRTEEGVTNNMRVTEQIFVSDAEGDRSYPTLALDTLITPGAWLSWDFNETWLNADGVWAEAGPPSW